MVCYLIRKLLQETPVAPASPSPTAAPPTLPGSDLPWGLNQILAGFHNSLEIKVLQLCVSKSWWLVPQIESRRRPQTGRGMEIPWCPCLILLNDMVGNHARNYFTTDLHKGFTESPCNSAMMCLRVQMYLEAGYFSQLSITHLASCLNLLPVLPLPPPPVSCASKILEELNKLF